MKNKSLKALRISIVFVALALYGGVAKAQKTTTKKGSQTMSKKAESMKTIKVEVKGMSCQEGCANGLDAMFKKVPGVITSKTSFDNSESEITFDVSKISAKEIVALIEKRGFTAKLLDSQKN